jgi:hypothetical protein
LPYSPLRPITKGRYENAEEFQSRFYGKSYPSDNNSSLGSASKKEGAMVLTNPSTLLEGGEKVKLSIF